MLFRTMGKLSMTAKIFEKYIDRSTWRELSALRNYLTARQKKNAKNSGLFEEAFMKIYLPNILSVLFY